MKNAFLKQFWLNVVCFKNSCPKVTLRAGHLWFHMWDCLNMKQKCPTLSTRPRSLVGIRNRMAGRFGGKKLTEFSRREVVREVFFGISPIRGTLVRFSSTYLAVLEIFNVRKILNPLGWLAYSFCCLTILSLHSIGEVFRAVWKRLFSLSSRSFHSSVNKKINTNVWKSRTEVQTRCLYEKNNSVCLPVHMELPMNRRSRLRKISFVIIYIDNSKKYSFL